MHGRRPFWLLVEILSAAPKWINGLSLLGNEERLQIRQVTREDAAVVECVGVNAFKKRAQLVILGECKVCTVKPVYNDHLYNKVYYLWFIQ